jgi:hypothetical protein
MNKNVTFKFLVEVKMSLAIFMGTLESAYNTKRPHNAEDHNRQERTIAYISGFHFLVPRTPPLRFFPVPRTPSPLNLSGTTDPLSSKFIWYHGTPPL